MKVCPTCPVGTTPQELGEFLGSRGQRSSCKTCYRRWAKEAYARRKADYILRARIRSSGLREEVSGLKSRPCFDCLLSFPSWAMDFDHLRDKRDGLNSMVRRRLSRAIILSEIEKCDPICVLCHRLRTKKRGCVFPSSPKAKDEARECPCPDHDLKRTPGCRGCKNASRLADYYLGRTASNARSVVLRRSRRKDRTAASKSSPCCDCRRSLDPVQMDFDHVRGSKSSNVSRLLADSSPLLVEEIEKCELVCAVCHRYRTLVRSGRSSPDDDLFMVGWTSLAV